MPSPIRCSSPKNAASPRPGAAEGFGAPRRMFADRADAGRRLGAALARYHDQKPVVLALPRGGVPVGLEVARALDAPLDVIVVRKLGAPGHEELAVGAIAAGAAYVDW